MDGWDLETEKFELIVNQSKGFVSNLKLGHFLHREERVIPELNVLESFYSMCNDNIKKLKPS